MKRFLLHESVKESVVRLFDSKKATTAQEAYDNREKYDVEMTLDWLTPDKVYVSGLMSRVQLYGQDIEDFKDYLRSKGVKEMWQERNGEMEVDYL